MIGTASTKSVKQRKLTMTVSESPYVNGAYDQVLGAGRTARSVSERGKSGTRAAGWQRRGVPRFPHRHPPPSCTRGGRGSAGDLSVEITPPHLGHNIYCKESISWSPIAASAHKLPIVIKPARQGSSVGISIVRTADQMLPAIQKALAFGEECLVEDFIEGREITVPVIDGDAFPIVEILPAAEWYDFNAKYNDQKTAYRVAPNDLPDGISELAVAACNEFGVSGIARVDLRLGTDGQPRILEVNTIPGMTTHSLVPKSGSQRGLSLAQICELAIQNELARDDASQSE